MATLSDSLVSSSARSLPIRMRPDLAARRQHYLGKSYWVVKEPVGLNYFRFQEEEYAILQMLDGRTSLDEIKERFEADFPPQKITLEELQQFLGMLHRSGLVIAGVGGQGRELRKRRDERRRKEILGAMSNILCIRFKGVDPERLLNWMYPKLSWIFTPAVAVAWFLLALAAATLVMVEFDVFQSKLPGFYQFFNWQNGLLLAVTLGLIKICHEFGHALSCKHYGGECHEIGIMILVLTPCLYCNVSDSWMLPNKWHRALIGAAGIFVEVGIASICTFLWWFSEPGLLNQLCLNAMFVASVSTIIFNANPLLRYDGYYVLADVAEIPNLRQKATTILSRKLAHLCLGLEPPEDPFLPQRNQIFFALYSVAAAAYRWFILASIMWFLFQVFKPYRLEILGHGIVMMSVYGLVVVPLYKVGKFFYVPGRLDKVKKPHMYTSLGVLTALILAVVYVPLPYSVMCPFEVQARDAEPVYVTVPDGGRVVSVDVKPGEIVYAYYTKQFERQAKAILPELYESGSRLLDEPFLAKLYQMLIQLEIEEQIAQRTVREVLARYGGPYEIQMSNVLETVKRNLAQQLAKLSNVDLDLEIARLTGERDQYRIQLKSLVARSYRDRSAKAEIPRVQEALATVEEQLAQKQKDYDGLWLRAPITGTIMPPDSIPRRDDAGGQLPTWSGTPFDPQNVGCFLQEANGRPVLFCQVGDPHLLEAVLVIDQADVEFVREMVDSGEYPEVEIKLDQLPHDTLKTTVVLVATSKMEFTPKRLSTKSGGDVPSIADEQTGQDRPQSPSYQASAPLGFYGHDDKHYRWLRGQLEHSPDGDTWQLRYQPEDATPDQFGGKILLADASLPSGYRHGDFVDVRGHWPKPDEDADASQPTEVQPTGETPAYQLTQIHRIDKANDLLRLGLRGRAKVHTRWMPLGTRLWRFIRHTFKFKM